MADEIFCRECKRELIGVLIVTESVVDKYVYPVRQETPDCNWRQCRGCRVILCKACDDAQRYYCCNEGFILSRERASAALKAQPQKHAWQPFGTRAPTDPEHLRTHDERCKAPTSSSNSKTTKYGGRQ